MTSYIVHDRSTNTYVELCAESPEEAFRMAGGEKYDGGEVIASPPGRPIHHHLAGAGECVPYRTEKNSRLRASRDFTAAIARALTAGHDVVRF